MDRYSSPSVLRFTRPDHSCCSSSQYMCSTHWILNPDTVGCSNPFTLQRAKQHINFILFLVLGPIWVAGDSCCAAGLISPPIGFMWDHLWEIRLIRHPGLEYDAAEAVVVYGNATATPSAAICCSLYLNNYTVGQLSGHIFLKINLIFRNNVVQLVSN